MRVRVTEWAETIIVLLSSRIPQGKLDVLPVHFDIGHIVLEHGGDINLTANTSDRDSKYPTSRAVSTECAVCTLRDPWIKLRRTSGKVPFEKTINKQV